MGDPWMTELHIPSIRDLKKALNIGEKLDLVSLALLHFFFFDSEDGIFGESFGVCK